MQAMHLLSKDNLRFLIDTATKDHRIKVLLCFFEMFLGILLATRPGLRCHTVHVTVEGSHIDYAHRNTVGT